MKLKFVEDFKKYTVQEKVIFSFAMLVATALLFYHGFIHTGLIKLPAARAQDCTQSNLSKDIEINIQNGAFIPSNITATVCDKLIFINKEDTLHEPATGPHPTHTSYPGFDARKALSKDERYEFVLNRAGSYTFHDHLNDQITGSIIISK